MPDIAGSIYGMLRLIEPELVTNFFILAIGGIFVWAVIDGRRARHSRFLEHAPTLTTSHADVVIGLLGFDTSYLDANTPK